MHNATQPIKPQTAVPADTERTLFWQIHLRLTEGGDKLDQCVREAFAEVAVLLKMPSQCTAGVLDDKEVLLFKTCSGYQITSGPDRIKLNNVCTLQPSSFGEIHIHHGIEPLIALWSVAKALSEANLGHLCITSNESKDMVYVKNFSDLRYWIAYFGGSYDAWHKKVQDVGLLTSLHQLIKPASEEEIIVPFF